jgi:hypothetical protein
MAAQTVTTVVNYDDAAISGLLNGETITINGGSVTVDADVRWNQQAAVFGAVTLSSTLGGSFLIDGTQVWEVPFSASSGNVPTQAALGSNGVTGGTSAATGELTRVWATGSLDPATAGAAMPGTGFIKLRSKTGNFQNGETITLPGGATVTASGAGQRSWIHVVGLGTATGNGGRLTIPRLATFEAEGDWYELGTTDGTDDQTFQFPVADQCPAIWIETAPASGVYAIWLNAGDRWSGANGGAVATGDKRGQYFGMNATTGVITIAARTGNTAGLKPASGCKVRIPNVIMSQAIAANYAANNMPTTNTFRYGFTTTSAGSVIMDKVSCNWLALTSAAFEVDISNAGVASIVSFTNTGTTVNLENVGIGLVNAEVVTPVTIATSYGGGTLTDVFAARRLTVANAFVFAFSDTADFTLTRCRGDVFGIATTNAPVATNSCFETGRAINTTMVDCVAIGGIGIDIQPGFGVSCTGFQFASRTIGTTQTTDTAAAISAGVGSTDVFIDGFSNFDGIANVHPYNNIIVTASGVNGCEIRNIGTPAAPYDMGTANACALVLSASTTRNVVMRRVYTQNTRTSPVTLANTVQGFEAYNLWGDAADSQANPAINSTIRGGRYTNSVAGQTAVYGTHWQDAWTSTTAGRIVISCNEPTTQTASQCSFTLDTAAGSGFTSAGNVSMTQLTDTVEWTMPYYALGVTGFANNAPTITGTNAANHTLEFQYDLNDGNGFNGSWLALSGANLSGITVDPNDGIKLKVRATVNTASQTNLLTYIRVDTTTTSSDQQIEYPLPTTALTASVNGIEPGSRIQIYNVTTTTEIANEIIAGTSWTLNYNEGTDFTNGDVVRIRVRLPGFLPYETLAIASLAGWSVLADQATDPIYNSTTPANVTVDYVNLKIRATSTRADFQAQEVVDIIRAAEATLDGIRLVGFADISGKVELSPGIFTAITVNLIGWQLSWAALSVSQATVGGGNIVGGILGDPVEDVVDGPQVTLQVSADATLVTVGSGVLPSDIVAIAAAVWDTVLASHLTAGTTGEALDDAAQGGGGGGGGGGATAQQVWEYATRTLTASSDPSASTIASQVRTELTTELARIDVATSTRLATAGYTAPANSDITAIKAKTDNLPADPASNTQVNTRLASASYVAPANADITAIKAKTDALPADPASNTQVNTRLATAGYTAPDNATITAINTKVQTLSNTDVSSLATQASVNALGTPLQASSYTAPDNAGITAIKAKTDNLPAQPASRGEVSVVNEGVKKASLLVPHTGNLP